MSSFIAAILSALGALPESHPVVLQTAYALGIAPPEPANSSATQAAPLVLDGGPTVSTAATVEAQVEGVLDGLLPFAPNPVPGLPPGVLLGAEREVLHLFGVGIVKLIEARAAK